MLYLTFVLYLTSAEQDPHGVESAHSKIYYLVKVSFNSDSRTEKLTKKILQCTTYTEEEEEEKIVYSIQCVVCSEQCTTVYSVESRQE